MTNLTQKTIVQEHIYIGWLIAALFVVAMTSSPAQAIPSFARQTGKPCAQCHTVAYGVALTAYGRQFKLNGYVWGDAETVIPPVAVMVQGGFTHTSKDQVEAPAAHFATNDNLSGRSGQPLLRRPHHERGRRIRSGDL